MSEKHVPNYEQPIRGVSWPDRKKVRCRDCAFRLVQTAEHNGEEIEIGAVKGFCEIYPNGCGKPNDVLFKNADCEYYFPE